MHLQFRHVVAGLALLGVSVYFLVLTSVLGYEPASRIVVDKAPAVANWSRLYDETLARLTAKVGGETLTLPEVLNRLSDPDGGRRKQAANALAKALAERESTLALCLNTIAFEKQVEDRWRRYPTPAASRHMANEVHAESVAALEAAVVESYPSISHRYYRLKAKAMGLKCLDHWDRNAPLTSAEPRRYAWDEARGMVLTSFAALAPKFAEAAEVFFNQPWIDARPRAGKQSGAYSHPVTSERHPYVFMNYMGERRDVLTLAHELGHAVHQTLAAPQGTLLADTPLTLAETASIFGEGLVFERLLADAKGEERKALLAGKIEDGLNTVVRQIAFHRFETRFHDLRAQGELSPEEIGGVMPWPGAIPVPSETRFVTSLVRHEDRYLPVFDLAAKFQRTMHERESLCLVVKHVDGPLAICIDAEVPSLQMVPRSSLQYQHGDDPDMAGSCVAGGEQLPIINLATLGVSSSRHA